MKHYKLSQILFYLFILTVPFGTRILFNSVDSYIGSSFNYHLATYLYISDIVLLALLGVWLVERKFRIVSWDLLNKLVLALIVVSFLGLFHVKRIDLGLFNAFKLTELLLLLLYVKHEVLDRRTLLLSLNILVFSSLIQAAIGLGQFHVQHGLGLNWLGEYIAPLGTPGLSTIDVGAEKLIRSYGTFPHPNIYAAFLIFGLLLCLYFVSRETLKFKIATFIVSCGTILITVATFTSFSRMAWFALALAYLSFLVFHVKQKSYRELAIIVVIGIVSCGTILGLYGDLIQSRTAELNSSSNSVVLRESFNSLAMEQFNVSPVLGVGIGNYIPTLLEEHPELQSWQYHPAHNIFIHLAAEIGIVGVLLFTSIIVLALRFTWNVRQDLLTYTFLTAEIIFLFISSFDHYFVTIQQGRLMFFLLIGLMFAVSPTTNYVSHNKISS